MKPSRNCLIRALFMTQSSSMLGSKWEEYVLSIQPRDVGRVEDRKKGSGRGKEGAGWREGGNLKPGMSTGLPQNTIALKPIPMGFSQNACCLSVSFFPTWKDQFYSCAIEDQIELWLLDNSQS